MVQYSVYSRAGISYERLIKHSERLKDLCPPDGFVRALFLTDRQWQEGINIIGIEKPRGNHNHDDALPEQIEFW